MSFAGTPYTWSLEPQVLFAVTVVGVAYALRLRVLWARESPPRRRSDYLRAASFGAGLTILVLAVMSPIDRLGEERLFSVHMVQHLLLAVVWGWHVEAMYELALNHEWAHELEHLTFFTAGTAFWWYVLEPVPPRNRLRGLWMSSPQSSCSARSASCSPSHRTPSTTSTSGLPAPGAERDRGPQHRRSRDDARAIDRARDLFLDPARTHARALRRNAAPA